MHEPQIQGVILVQDRDQPHALTLPAGDLSGDGLQVNRRRSVEEDPLTISVERFLQNGACAADRLDLVRELGPGPVAPSQQRDECGSLQFLLRLIGIGSALGSVPAHFAFLSQPALMTRHPHQIPAMDNLPCSSLWIACSAWGRCHCRDPEAHDAGQQVLQT
ncbi:hypothetical protein [Streptomyces sp. NBC_01803]|uniref:hypothetical protein n=1 Tax=Streptomyces sp. NBC_01803 TaxID=2975946 RepID=UPI002DDA582F|nr:hypothetical protein [Streptomyces sp. NBC_01803]WSA46369.1 hypothetical protein OIE51_20580 [Streptomyces sp. NBC_01803]